MADLALDNIQGNILAGFNKDLQSFLFLRLPEGPDARIWLASVVTEVATTSEVLAFNQLFKQLRARRGHETGTVEATWMNLALTHAGLRVLGVPEEELALFPQEFQDGLRAHAEALGHVGASAPDQWLDVFKNDDVHVILIVAADDQDDLDETALRYLDGMAQHGVSLLAKFDGRARQDEPGHEHFGFKDGVSQPGIADFTEPLQPGQDAIAPGEFVLGYEMQPPPPTPPAPPPVGQYGAPPPPVPEPDPSSGTTSMAGPPWTADGSFLVFERLRQDVKGFKDAVGLVALAQNRSPELVGAKLVGRHKSGCPLERIASLPDAEASNDDLGISQPEILGPEHINDFEYEPDDADGHLVPRGAHIRKTYPRNEQTPGGGEADTQRHRLLRRGIAYGESYHEGAPVDSPANAAADRGLLFAAYQTSIARQFEVVQAQWVNGSDFPQPADGGDPILSENGATVKVPGFDPDSQTFQPFVMMTGGGYFFTPSISALTQLSAT